MGRTMIDAEGITRRTKGQPAGLRDRQNDSAGSSDARSCEEVLKGLERDKAPSVCLAAL